MIERWLQVHNGITELHVPNDALPVWLFESLGLAQRGQFPEALAKAPEQVACVRLEALVWAGILWQAGQLSEAQKWFDCACSEVDHPLVLNEAARFYMACGQPEMALTLRQRALDDDPGNALVCANLGDDLLAMGDVSRGRELLQKAVTLAPDHPVIYSMWLSCLHYDECLDPEQSCKAHRQWGFRFGSPVPIRPLWENPPTTGPLRIGYLSPDFCRHSVACFLAPFLEAHDPNRVVIYGYGNVTDPDEVTQQLSRKMNFYRNVVGVSAKQVADWVRADQIDILVDLCGHFRGHRLDVMALRPAPIQVTYLGYPDTTGLAQIDYRLTDAWADPTGADSFCTENLWRLPRGFLCYRPFGTTPPVAPLPAHKNGYVTFGSFNNNRKFSHCILETWAQILHRVPEARLVLKFKNGHLPAVQDRYLLALERLGVTRARVTLMGWQAESAHWKTYHDIDIALDTYPYHGTTTTCEALWMGVPCLSWIGRHHASRVGLSLLTQVGLADFTAANAEEYVGKAVAFAGQLDALTVIRQGLRGRMLGSALCDARGFCEQIENAFAAMIRKAHEAL